MIDFELKDGPADLDRKFVVEVDGKLKITAYATDPYSLWQIKFSHGTVPKDLSGQWTSRDLARHAIDQYLEKRNKEVTAVKETVKDFAPKVA